MVEQFDKGGRFEDLLADIYQTFSGWINDNYTTYDIVCEPQCFKYDELYNEWFYELAYEIYHNELDYFTNEDKKNEIYCSGRNNSND